MPSSLNHGITSCALEFLSVNHKFVCGRPVKLANLTNRFYDGMLVIENGKKKTATWGITVITVCINKWSINWTRYHPLVMVAFRRVGHSYASTFKSRVSAVVTEELWLGSA